MANTSWGGKEPPDGLGGAAAAAEGAGAGVGAAALGAAGAAAAAWVDRQTSTPGCQMSEQACLLQACKVQQADHADTTNIAAHT